MLGLKGRGKQESLLPTARSPRVTPGLLPEWSVMVLPDPPTPGAPEARKQEEWWEEVAGGCGGRENTLWRV